MDESSKVAEALGGLESDPVALVASGAEVTMAEGEAAFSTGTKVNAVVRSWRPDGTGTGGTMIIQVKQPDAAEMSYLAVMVLEAGMWKVAATLSIESPSPEPSR